MPISEDEYDPHHHHHDSNIQSTMSKAEQRRSNKPIMEKRRRARINHCLNELKTLILDAMKKDPARHSKLEKADILEMTVKHLQTLQRQQLAVAVATDPTVLHKFKTGFNECAGEVSRYIGNMEGVETGVKQRLVAHLSNCVTGLQQVSPFTFPGVGISGTVAGNTASIPVVPQGNSGNASSSSNFSGDVNNNQNTTRVQVPPGIQLIPSRLPTGELALLVPNSSNLPFFSSSILSGSQTNFNSSDASNISSQRTTNNSAFTTVRPSKTADSLKMTSPPLSPASSTTSFDDHHLPESFQRPRTPSPKEVTVSFPTPPGPSHHLSTFKHGFPSLGHDQKPAQQFQVTSTSYSPDTKTDIDLKIEYKTVPIYQPSEKPRDLPYRSYASRSLEPLSVITSEKSKSVRKETSQKFEESRCRKRPHAGEISEGLLTVAKQDYQPSTSKYVKYSPDNVSTTIKTPGIVDQRFSTDPQFQKPSTSGCSTQPNDSNNDHMWRPW